MGEQSLYKELAKYYDRVYHWKDYDDDVGRLGVMVNDLKTSTGSSLLDVGCGTGAHVSRLVDSYECTGIDNREEMLRVAREKVPGANFLKADMMDFDLGRRFDVVVSMFGTIGYALTLDDLGRVIDNIAKHLSVGGVAVIEPFVSRSNYIPGHVAMTTYEDDDVKISRVSSARLDDEICTFEMHYLVGEKGKGVRYILDTHRARLHEPEEFLAAMESAGLEASYDPIGFGQERGAVIAIKPESNR
jgi:ubiquinone/menaquinone biosynthesis C-methylase UbiE